MLVANCCFVYFRTDDSVEPLIEKLEKLWEAFVTSISSSVSDYLSVEHLALILRKLAELGMSLYVCCVLFIFIRTE
jgi:hypothetical protein